MTRRPRIWVATLGGTAMMSGSPSSGLTPALHAEDLLAQVAGLADVADIEAVSLPPRPGASLEFADIIDICTLATDAVDNGAAGAVLVQGTDTLEETAYLLDLYWARTAPLVVTGAMRAPGQPGADGPANLLAAITTAADSSARGLGVLAVMADEVHPARFLAKTDTVSPHAFRSAPFGPIGRLAEGRLTLAARPARLPALPPPVDLAVRVGILEVTLGDRELALLAGVSAAGLSGLVVAAAGAGHVPAAAVPHLEALASVMPVVLASRTGAGPILQHTYAFRGSERDLLARGMLSAGWLAPRKARLLLWALLAARQPPTRISAELGIHSVPP